MIFRVLLVPILFFGVFYALFWNVKHWTLEGWRLAGTVILCAIVATICTVVVTACLILVFN